MGNTNGDIIIYQTDDGLTKIDVRVENETVWLSQQQMAELFGSSRTNIIEHINNIYAEEELDKESTCQNFRQVRKEGNRNVTREIPFYNLDMIISLGYRIKSKIATNFRKWATERLKEYMIKGFTMDDERLKGNGGGNYWKELLARIKDIRSSEKVMYRQVLDLYATAVDYNPKDEKSIEFFKIVQNKLHYATHGHTASEVIYKRADAEKPFMGLTTFKGDIPVLQDVVIAKNYLNEDELKVLNNLVSGYFDFAEIQAIRHNPMYMEDYIKQLDMILSSAGGKVLIGAGSVSHNQAIKNDKRLEYQDDKKRETGLDIIILDKTWILDKALNIKNVDLLKIINITQPLKEKQIGPNDLKKQMQIEEIERKLQDYSSKKLVNQDVINLSMKSAILSRDLEDDEVTVTGKFERALRFAKEKNNIVAQREILYNLSWYYNWWLNDDTNFEKYYIEYQNEIIKDKKIEEILKLVTLWTLLYTRKNRDKNKVKDETNILLKLLNEKKNSPSRVTQLKAETQTCIINILLEKDIDKQFDKLIAIVKEATKFKEYDFLTLSKMVENMLPIFSDNDKYNKLYELVTDKLANRNCEIQRAKMYLKKAKMLLSNNKYYESINILGKCLTFLYKNETDGKLVEAYVNIGGNFESIGLHYAAKNYYIAAITMFIDIYLKDRYLDSFSLKVINRIIDLEISDGNIEEAIEWFSIKNILLSILYESNENINFDKENDYFIQRDALISSEILNTKVSDFHLLPKIIEMCNKYELVTSEVMAKYTIGEYDKQLLDECNGNKEKVDKLIEGFYKDSLNQKLPLPVYNNGNERTIYSFLCGNKIKIVFTSSKLMHRFAEFLIALLENTFATIHTHHTYMRGDIVILIQQKNSGKFDINYSFDGIDTYTIILDSFEMYDISVENHNLITDILFKLLANILAVNFIYEDYNKTFKEIFEDDKSFERSLNHTNSLYNLNKIFGQEKDIDIPNYSISRDVEWYKNLKIDKVEKETVDPFEEKKNIIYGVPENNPFENISHKNIYSSGMIKCNHWDIAKWKGVVYLGDRLNKELYK